MTGEKKTALLGPLNGETLYPEDIAHGGLPQPPPVAEQFSIFGKQKRRLLAVTICTLSLGSLYGIWAVFSKSWMLYPWIGMLVILVPWSVYTLILTLVRPSITAASHDQVFADTSQDLASVDIFIPVCGERLEVLANTFRHVRGLAWRGPWRVYVLDDGASREVHRLCREHGFNYIVRPNRGEYKKAGNLNHGLKRSDGEYIVVFDADFAPAPGFLAQLLPYFSDRKVGIAQTSQYFDVDRERVPNWLQRHAGTIQEMFFTYVQPSQEKLNAAMCVGTNVCYRRAALETAGGWPAIDGGEDVITGIDLMRYGYRTVYVPLNLAKGLCPETFATAVNQQYRWCLSSISYVFPSTDRNIVGRIFHACRMTVTQRISFLSCTFYYLQSVLALITGVMPSLVMIWCFPYQVDPRNYCPLAPAMLGMFAMPVMIRGWRPPILRLVMIYSVAHLLAITDSLRGSAAAWVPTGGSGHRNPTPVMAGRVVRIWLVVTQGLAWWGIALALPVYKIGTFWPAIALSGFQAIVLFPLLLPGYGVLPWRDVLRTLMSYARMPGKKMQGRMLTWPDEFTDPGRTTA